LLAPAKGVLQAVAAVSLLDAQRLAGRGHAHDRRELRAGLEEVDLAVQFDPAHELEDLVGQADLGQDLALERALHRQAVDREEGARARGRVVGLAGDVLELAQERDQPRDPVHAVDDLGREPEQREALEHSAAEDSVAAPVVRIGSLVVAVGVARAEELGVVDQDDRQIPEQRRVDHDPRLRRAVLGLDLADLAQVRQRAELHLRVEGEEYPDLATLLPQGARERLRNLG